MKHISKWFLCRISKFFLFSMAQNHWQYQIPMFGTERVKYTDHRCNLPTIWKTRLLLKSWASMSENSGSQFFRTTTGIQSGQEIQNSNSRFASAVSKCQSPFHSICFGNKNAEAVKFWEIKKKSFPGTKKEIFCKRKIDFFHKKIFFYKIQIIHVHLYSLFMPSFHTFLAHYSST